MSVAEFKLLTFLTANLQEIVPEWQSAASELVVALGRTFGRTVLEELTVRFTPGVVPHYYVIKTMGDFASTNGEYSMVSFLSHRSGFPLLLPFPAPNYFPVAKHLCLLKESHQLLLLTLFFRSGRSFCGSPCAGGNIRTVAAHAWHDQAR